MVDATGRRPTVAGDRGRPGRGVVIERARRLSESSLWSAQRGYYERSGAEAWASGDVPYLLTTGPLIARAYASLIESFAEDLLAGRCGGYDADEPLYVVELGAGSGRLGFELLRALEARDCGGLRIVVVLADGVEANISRWLGHERFRDHLRRGALDVAHYEAGTAAELTLRHAGVALGPGPTANPPVVIANYFFDVLPQDLYSVVDGVLSEDFVALCARDRTLTTSSPDLFSEVFLLPEREVATPRAIAEDQLLLQARADRAAPRGDERFLFPAVALETLRAFVRLGGGRMLALIGERPGRALSATEELETGDVSEVDGAGTVSTRLETEGSLACSPGALLAMGVHGGSMSLPVDFEVVAEFARLHDGELLAPAAEPTVLFVTALALGIDRALGVRRRFARLSEEQWPEDTYLMIKTATDRNSEISLAAALGALRLGGYDSYLFRQCYPVLERELKDAPEALLAEAERILLRLEADDFALADSGPGDLAFGIASLLAPAGRYEAALELFGRSATRRGPSAVARYNMALCHLHLEEPDEALSDLDEAVRLDPDYAAAIELRRLVLEERTRREGSGTDEGVAVADP